MSDDELLSELEWKLKSAERRLDFYGMHSTAFEVSSVPEPIRKLAAAQYRKTGKYKLKRIKEDGKAFYRLSKTKV